MLDRPALSEALTAPDAHASRRTYAVPDLHGRFDLLMAALARIEAHGPAGGTIVFLGDYVDRGPNSRQIIEHLMAGPQRAEWRWVCLKGNHEAMMIETLKTPLDPDWWVGNGGAQTLASYGHQVVPGAPLPDVIPPEHVDWIANLPMIHVDRHRVYVHAGVDEALPLDEQAPKTLMWKVYQESDVGGHGERHIVHGHRSMANGPLILHGRSDLDTLAWSTGRLMVGVFDDAVAGWPIELLEIRG